MKACIIQPTYSTDYSKSEEYFAKELALLHQCDESMDLIVLPEASDIPCLAGSKENADRSSQKFTDVLLKEVAETARSFPSMIAGWTGYPMAPVRSVYEKTLAELQELDFGIKYGEEFRSIKIHKNTLQRQPLCRAFFYSSHQPGI